MGWHSSALFYASNPRKGVNGRLIHEAPRMNKYSQIYIGAGK
jgi:hypothetical protein